MEAREGGIVLIITRWLFIICRVCVSRYAHASAVVRTYVFKTWKDVEERKERGGGIAYKKVGAWKLPGGLTEFGQLQTPFCNRTILLQMIARAMNFASCPFGQLASRQSRSCLRYSTWNRSMLLASLPGPQRRCFQFTKRRMAEDEGDGKAHKSIADADFWKEYKSSCMLLSLWSASLT